MATIADIQNWFANNPTATDADIAAAAKASGVTPDQIAQATGTPLSQVVSRINAVSSNAPSSSGTTTASGASSTTSATPDSGTAASSVPTWNSVYNDWFANEYLPWINSTQGTNVKASDLTKNEAGAYVPNAATPLWNWNTGADTAAQKAALDQRYIDAVNSYNQANGTNIKPDTSVLGANAQPNTAYRAADKKSGILGTGIGPDVSFSDAAKLAALYYGGTAALDAFGAEAAGAGTVGELPAGYAGYAEPTVTDLGTVAGSTEGIASGAESLGGLTGSTGTGLTAAPGAGTSLYDAGANLSSMGGAQGLAGGNTLAGIADMGGAQGLTTAAAGGGILGASGVGGALTPAAAGIGTGLGLSDAAIGAGGLSGLAAAGGAAAGAGAGAAAASTITGSALGDAALISGGVGLAGAALQSQAAKDAANTQAAAAQAAAQQQMDMFNAINAQQAPYRAAGYGALSNLGALGTGQYQMYDANGKPAGTGTGSGYLQHQFNAADLAAGLAPNYDFMLQQGQMANQRAANAAGGGLGGNALTGLNRYTQDYAGNAYQNAFNNYQTQRSNIYNTLAGIAGIGQTGQTATNTAATNAVNAATQLGVGSAAAQAAGTTGTANAYGSALSNIGNNLTLASLLNQRGNVATL